MQVKSYRVGISGSYGGWNIGDEAILEGIIKQLRRQLPVEFTVFTRDRGDTLRRHGVERAVAARELSRQEVRSELENLDVLVIGGGGILFDSEAEVYLREAVIAQELGIPVMIYAVGAGPLASPSARQLVAATLERAEVVTVRERRSKHLLEQTGIRREIQVTADPAFLLEPVPLAVDTLGREGVSKDRPLVGISVREPGLAAPDLDENHYHQLLADAADYMVYRYDANLLFMPMERRVLDLQQGHAVVSMMARADRAMVLNRKYTAGELLSLVGQLDFAIGMRLHFLIFAALQGVPFVPLPYAGKVAGLLEDLQMPVHPVQEIGAGQLIARIDRSWDMRPELRERIAAHLPGIRARARVTNQLLVDLLQHLPREQGPAGPPPDIQASG